MKKQEQKRPCKLDQKIAALSLPMSDQRTLADLMITPIIYMPDDRFRRPSVMAPIMEAKVEVVTGQTLTAEEEQSLFLQMNYTRHRICSLRRSLLRRRVWPGKTVQQLLECNKLQLNVRSKIVTANMGLVLAMAKRVHYDGVEFTDLVSEGSMALLRATERFDCSRGVKFSTYACRAILKGFSRAAKQSYRYRSRFPVQLGLFVEKDDCITIRQQEKRAEWIDEIRSIVNDNLADLSGTEQSVVELRFSLDDDQESPMTLKQVGARLGLTKERIRQIQNHALDKLRTVASDIMYADGH